MSDARLTGSGAVDIDGESTITFGPSTVISVDGFLGSNPLTISAVGNLDLGNADIDVQSNFTLDEDLLIESTDGSINFGTADIFYNATNTNV